MTETSEISRAEAARTIDELLESHRSFSFLRLGDGELRFLLEMQGREWMISMYGFEAFA
jgi:hypothetical protein